MPEARRVGCRDMAHTYTANYFHLVFSTKNHERRLSAELAPRVYSYIGGIARTNGFKAMAVGGTDDHVHVLMSLPATMSVARATQLIKGGSSRWIHETFQAHSRFAWQQAYGAFTIGVSQIEATKEYIANQREHHKKRDFRAEFIAFLKKHGIEYDERYVMG